MARVTFEFDDRRMRARVRALGPTVNQAVAATVDYHATLGEAVLRTNAPWTDRTGAARSSLHTETMHSGGRHTIVMAHGVPYGIWLEIANSGRYQVIMPAVREVGEVLMANLRGLMSRL